MREDASSSPGVRSLEEPSSAQVLEAVLELGRDAHLDMDEATLVERFCRALGRLFPDRRLAVRVADVRSSEPSRVYCQAGTIRSGATRERFTFRRSSIAKSGLKMALAESALVQFSQRWSCPFEDTAAGFAVPMVAAGELYGVVDVGYPLGLDGTEQDEALIVPMVNHLSVALRNERLHRETTNLRDYQAKLIEHANALIISVGRDWRINVCNRAVCRLTGYEHSELMGTDLRDLMPAEENRRLARLFGDALGGKRTENLELTLPTKSGDKVKTVWNIAGVGKKGRVEALVGIGQDQTQLLALQGQVIHAEKLATLGQIAAGVVHELNNPLTSIIVYAEFLAKALEAPDAKVGEGELAKLKQIGASARRIMSFAKDLVQYAKPGSEALEPRELNLAVKQGLSFCAHMFEGGQIELRSQFAEDLPRTPVVAGQLEQVVINLVTNAVHAIDGPGQVIVSTSCGPQGTVLLEVADDGPGIEPAERERVFEPFFTTKTDGLGTGLGLSIIKNIVERHKGSIRVDASSLGGALFRVVLPAADGGEISMSSKSTP